MARPKKGFDLDSIEKLAAIHCSNTEIASVIGCDVSLLSKPGYSKIITKGKERGKMSLRKKMFETAMGGNVTMQIWLSKQMLGYTDKVEQKTEAEMKHVFQKVESLKALSMDQKKQLVSQLQNALYRGDTEVDIGE